MYSSRKTSQSEAPHPRRGDHEGYSSTGNEHLPPPAFMYYPPQTYGSYGQFLSPHQSSQGGVHPVRGMTWMGAGSTPNPYLRLMIDNTDTRQRVNPDRLTPLMQSFGTSSALGTHRTAHPTTAQNWEFFINSQRFVVTPQERKKERGKRVDLPLPATIHDIISASLYSLTENYNDQEKLLAQAKIFSSVLTEENAIWELDVSNIPHRIGQAIYGLTPFSRERLALGRFVRFRFPFVRFEWAVLTSYSAFNDLFDLNEDIAKVEVLWKAWSKSGAASGLVAYGTCTDDYVMGDHDHLLIKKRVFVVTNVFQPELMTPVPYRVDSPPLARHDDFLIFSTSQTMIQSLRTSHKWLTVLVAISALLASLKPVVDRSSTTAGFVLAGIGITAAIISLVTVLIDWLLGWIEANAAKQRQKDAVVS